MKQLLARCTNWITKKCYYMYCTTKQYGKFFFANNPQKTCLAQKTRQNFTCTWPEHSAIVSTWTLKCNASAVVVVEEKMWISQNMLWLPCSNRMSRLLCMKREEITPTFSSASPKYVLRFLKKLYTHVHGLGVVAMVNDLGQGSNASYCWQQLLLSVEF